MKKSVLVRVYYRNPNIEFSDCEFFEEVIHVNSEDPEAAIETAVDIFFYEMLTQATKTIKTIDKNLELSHFIFSADGIEIKKGLLDGLGYIKIFWSIGEN